MRILPHQDRSSGWRTPPARVTLPGTGYTFIEVLVATAILGFAGASVYWGLAAGNSLIQCTRENLRATQVMVQKMEAIRLLTWSQVGDTNNYLTSNFVEVYDPLGSTNSSGGAKYRCYVSASTPAVGELPEAYRTNMRTITVTLYWTNYSGAAAVVHKREMQTRVARNGMQNYIWGAL
ncbi:MAG TPA: type II secretion system protein [Candidatus Binatia bacterium]|jgi:prepilin-type N-terminal cleavage/methylation domain-containing protein|nr:type II secretion system protein [Candidatus Binatia bacterium]